MTEDQIFNDDIDPCPDPEILQEYASDQIDDEFVQSIVEAHLQFCPRCGNKVRRLRSGDSPEDFLRAQADLFRRMAAEARRAETDGPLPGTLWRAVPESEEDLYGPLLLVIEVGVGDEGNDVKVVEVSEDIDEAMNTDIIVAPEESGLDFRFMARGGNCFETKRNNLKNYVGGLTEILTLKIIKFCQRTQSLDADIPLSEYGLFKDTQGSRLMLRKGVLSGLFPNGDDDPRLFRERESKDKFAYLKQDSEKDEDGETSEATTSDKVIKLRAPQQSISRIFLQVAAVIIAVVATWLLSQMMSQEATKQLRAQYEKDRQKLER
ncbi:hypothetical protein GF413_04595, partial [Candidatus Micrarchaeota archaeon]|nr:hypothetical protein [Candidatus Micrarchaeota archaeon]